MKRKAVPIIIIITTLLLFGTAASCNMCGINYTTDTTASVTSKNTDTSHETTGKETASQTTEKETAAETTEKETAAETEAQIEGSSPVIKLIEVTDTGSDVVYDASSEDVPKEWMNQLPVSLELFFHLELSDPDNDKLFCSLSDSNGNNYEPIPVNSEGYADFYWTTPAEPGGLTMRFVISDDSGMETVKELSFTFVEY